MPKRLSDVTHAFERTGRDLDDAQEALTQATESLAARVAAAGRAHREVIAELSEYLASHPAEIVVANDYGYHWDRGQIVRRPVFWAHHIWIEDQPADGPCYVVPADPSPEEMTAFNSGYHMGRQSNDPISESVSGEMVAAWDLGTPEEAET